MAQENVKLFKEKLVSSDELQEKLKKAEEAYTGDKQDRDNIIKTILIPLAEEAGLPFTLEEAKAAETGEGGLSDDELSSVAGGSGPTFGACLLVGGGVGAGCVGLGAGFCIVLGDTVGEYSR
jgi:hypothetical protein